MKLLLAICSVMFVISTSAFAQYTGEPGTGGPNPNTGTRPGPVPAPQTPTPVPPKPGHPPVIIHPAPYLAIAFSAYTGAVGHAQGYTYQSEVEHAALNFCGPACRLVAVSLGGHIALAVGRGNGFGYAISMLSLDEAKEHALRNCRQFTRRCKIRAYASSGDRGL